jgi:hypothetical protein
LNSSKPPIGARRPKPQAGLDRPYVSVLAERGDESESGSAARIGRVVSVQWYRPHTASPCPFTAYACLRLESNGRSFTTITRTNNVSAHDGHEIEVFAGFAGTDSLLQ